MSLTQEPSLSEMLAEQFVGAVDEMDTERRFGFHDRYSRRSEAMYARQQAIRATLPDGWQFRRDRGKLHACNSSRLRQACRSLSCGEEQNIT